MTNLVPLSNDLIYETLWKGKYSKEYIIDFLNSYFHYYGDMEIKDITFLKPDIFNDDKDIKKRIHVYYKRGKKEYYYELKFCFNSYKNECFDVNFLPFLANYGRYQNDNVKIGQIVIQMTNKPKIPIEHYYLKNDNLKPLGKSFDIHIINIQTLNEILIHKDIVELNSFEKWIRVLSCKSLPLTVTSSSDEVIKKYLEEWKFNSKMIKERNLINRNKRGDFALKLLDDGYPLELVIKITKLDMSYLIDLKRKRDGNEIN